MKRKDEDSQDNNYWGCGKKGPAASRRLRRVKATENTGVCFAGKERTSLVCTALSLVSWVSALASVCTSHNFTVLSPEPEASRFPSALKSSCSQRRSRFHLFAGPQRKKKIGSLDQIPELAWEARKRRGHPREGSAQANHCYPLQMVRGSLNQSIHELSARKLKSTVSGKAPDCAKLLRQV